MRNHSYLTQIARQATGETSVTTATLRPVNALLQRWQAVQGLEMPNTSRMVTRAPESNGEIAAQPVQRVIAARISATGGQVAGQPRDAAPQSLRAPDQLLTMPVASQTAAAPVGLTQKETPSPYVMPTSPAASRTASEPPMVERSVATNDARSHPPTEQMNADQELLIVTSSTVMRRERVGEEAIDVTLSAVTPNQAAQIVPKPGQRTIGERIVAATLTNAEENNQPKSEARHLTPQTQTNPVPVMFTAQTGAILSTHTTPVLLPSPALRRAVPPSAVAPQSAGVHIGTVDIHLVSAAPPATPIVPAYTQAAASHPLARGFTTSFGLRQG